VIVLVVVFLTLCLVEGDETGWKKKNQSKHYQRKLKKRTREFKKKSSLFKETDDLFTLKLHRQMERERKRDRKRRRLAVINYHYIMGSIYKAAMRIL
jgi:type IV secretory pathway component VirB8